MNEIDRVEKDRAKGALEAHLPVDHHREQYAKPEGAEDIEYAKEEHITPGDIPSRRREQTDILEYARELVVGHQSRAGDRKIRCP
jgi:hypothetical protein